MTTKADTDHVPGVVYMEPKVFENHSQDTRYKGPLDVAQTVAATYGMGGNNQPFVVEPARVHPIHDQATRFSGKRGDKADGKGNGLGVGQEGDPMNTLTSGDRHAVAYQEPLLLETFHLTTNKEKAQTLKARDYKDPLVVAIDREAYNCGENFARSPGISDDGVNPTLVARGPSAVAYEPKGLGIQSSSGIGAIGENVSPCLINGDNPGWQNGVMETTPRYIVRRLTPTECARLQGFADRWGDIEEKKELTAEEYEFWLEVRNTHARVNGKKVQDYTVKQMLTWYNKLHTDSAEYKMWGNGIALPPALYVMQGIVDALNITTNEEEDLDDWMN